MKINILHQNLEYKIDTSKMIDLSIPYFFNGNQPNFFDVEKGKLTPLKTQAYSWSVQDGASCNVPEISMNIHCTGTHTESVGHLLKNPGDIGSILTESFFSSILITISPELCHNVNEKYHCKVSDEEYIITAASIKRQFEMWKDFQPDALIIRTLPNHQRKQFLRFNESIPPFFTNDALKLIHKLKIKHLIVDVPSVDRMDDKGLLGNHRIFWGDGLNANSEVNSDSQKTITELAYIPNTAKDGLYFLNIQIPHFVCDAAPSRPLLYSVV